MTNLVTHLTLTGDWTLCPSPGYCPLLFHFPGLTPVEMAAVPEEILWALCEIVQPPDVVLKSGAKRWLDTANREHREYDLPATFFGNDGQRWARQGLMHRDRGRPALIYAPGGGEVLRREWWSFGKLVRAETPLTPGT